MWGSFEILESYVGERVNKIRFDGSIKRENLVKSCQYVRLEKREKNQRRREEA